MRYHINSIKLLVYLTSLVKTIDATGEDAVKELLETKSELSRFYNLAKEALEEHKDYVNDKRTMSVAMKFESCLKRTYELLDKKQIEESKFLPCIFLIGIVRRANLSSFKGFEWIKFIDFDSIIRTAVKHGVMNSIIVQNQSKIFEYNYWL